MLPSSVEVFPSLPAPSPSPSPAPAQFFFRFDETETETETQVRGTLLLPFRFLIEDTVSIFSKLLSTSCLLTDSVPWLLPGAGHIIVTAGLVEEALPPLRVLEHQTLNMETWRGHNSYSHILRSAK